MFVCLCNSFFSFRFETEIHSRVFPNKFGERCKFHCRHWVDLHNIREKKNGAQLFIHGGGVANSRPEVNDNKSFYTG